MAQSNRSNQDRGRGRRRKSKKKIDPAIFWGSPEQLSEIEPETVEITSYPAAVVKSLSRPPLANQQNAADLYFTAIYDRATNLAAALATAGQLTDQEDQS